VIPPIIWQRGLTNGEWVNPILDCQLLQLVQRISPLKVWHHPNMMSSMGNYFWYIHLLHPNGKKTERRSYLQLL
jgi:hypothetical protein